VCSKKHGTRRGTYGEKKSAIVSRESAWVGVEPMGEKGSDKKTYEAWEEKTEIKTSPHQEMTLVHQEEDPFG